jgi:glucose/arabinose dehydrogenase
VGRTVIASLAASVVVFVAVGGLTACGQSAAEPVGLGPGAAATTVDATGAAAADPDSDLGHVRLEPYGGSFVEPVALVAVPGRPGDAVVVEKGGLLVLVRGGHRLDAPYLDVAARVSTGPEQGLLSLAFAADFATSGLAYIFFTDTHGDVQIEEYRQDDASADRLDPTTRRSLLTVRQPYPNHNGGQLLFDHDGMLLIGLGDGGDEFDPAGRSQNLRSLLGKILRIDPRPDGTRPYRVPDDNPFIDRPGILPEIWASGLRNPWRFSLDAETGNLIVGDVGQNLVEELDVVSAVVAARGANYGWSRYEGDLELFPERRLEGPGPVVRPALTYRHVGNACSVTAGGVYRGSVASLRGAYLYADFCTGEVFAAFPRDGGRVGDSGDVVLEKPVRLPVTGGAVASFGTDGNREMYIVDLAGGINRIVGPETTT